MVGWLAGTRNHCFLYPCGMVNIETGFCRSDELETVLGHLNQEFIYSRGRNIEVQYRFPGLNKPQNFLVRRVEGAIVSALALKRFVLETAKEQYNAAMIGLVWTLPSMRAKGHAAAILNFARLQLIQEQRDFAVLWTSQPHVYSGQGWIEADCGRYGVLSGHAGNYTDNPINQASIDSIQEIRKAFAPMRICGDVAAEFPLPLPATQLRLLIETDAYAIIGLAKDNAYVFDILGTPHSLSTLWTRLSASGKNIHMNVPAGSPADEWVTRILHTNLPPKPLAMWLPLSGRARDLDYASIYIPIIDRL